MSGASSKFVSYDPTVPQPTPVTGWWDPALYTPDQLPPEGRRLAVTDAEWDNRVPKIWAVDGGKLVEYIPPPPPPPTLPQQATLMLSSPVTVICESKPDLTANYANTAQVRANMVGVVSQINAGMGLPGGGPTFNWPDVDGGARSWPASEFVAFANALTNMAYHCGQVIGGFSDELPSATLTISGAVVRVA